MSALRLSEVRKCFGPVTALDGVDVDVPVGSFAALLGPSGCGKTTLLRAVAGFERLDGGTITIAGTEVASPGLHVPPERRRVGIVPQEGALFPHLTVSQNVAFGLPRRERRRGGDGRVDELLELVGLEAFARRRPHELSGGQQQRVALARCLAPRPALVLLDEPFAALDAGLRLEVREHTRRVLRECGATALLVTHDQEEALSTADLVVLLRAGRVVQVGAPVALYERPADTWAARFVGHANLLPATLDGGVATCALGRVPVEGPVPPDGASGRRLLLRPEQLRLVPGAQGRVVSHRFLGHESLVRVVLDAVEGELVVRVGGAPPVPGTPVSVEACGAGVLCADRDE